MNRIVLFSKLTKAGFLFVLISLVSCIQNPPDLTIDYREHAIILDNNNFDYFIKDVYFTKKGVVHWDTILSYSLLHDSIGDLSIRLGKKHPKYVYYFDNSIMLKDNTEINVFARICIPQEEKIFHESLFIFNGTYSWEYLSKNKIKLYPLNPRI